MSSEKKLIFFLFTFHFSRFTSSYYPTKGHINYIAQLAKKNNPFGLILENMLQKFNILDKRAKNSALHFFFFVLQSENSQSCEVFEESLTSIN